MLPTTALVRVGLLQVIFMAVLRGMRVNLGNYARIAGI
jgi:hypothetical protein